MFGATSGKAYPWALHAWDNRVDVAQRILERLLYTLRQRLVLVVPLVSPHRDSGSDSGRNGVGYRRVRPVGVRIDVGEDSD